MALKIIVISTLVVAALANPMAIYGAVATPSGIQGGPAWCTFDKSGGGRANNDVTKDCCAATRHKAYYNEFYRTCTGNGGQIDNAVDHGKFGKCCDSRGGGSHG
jgi:hypothetical protein